MLRVVLGPVTESDVPNANTELLPVTVRVEPASMVTDDVTFSVADADKSRLLVDDIESVFNDVMVQEPAHENALPLSVRVTLDDATNVPPVEATSCAPPATLKRCT